MMIAFVGQIMQNHNLVSEHVLDLNRSFRYFQIFGSKGQKSKDGLGLDGTS